MDDPTPVPAETLVKKSKGRTLEWLSRHPMIVLSGFLVGVISLLLSIYFFVASQRSRELSYQVDPTRTTIVKSGQSSDLHVLYKGQDVSTDVTALEVVIWNAGRESIRSENLLTPITLTTSPKAPILEARIEPGSRSVSQIRLDTSEIGNGSVGVAWKILEHGNGAKIQLIVAGPTKVTVKCEGDVEGQQEGIIRYDVDFSKLLRSNGLELVRRIGFLFVSSMLLGYSARVLVGQAERRVGWNRFLTGC